MEEKAPADTTLTSDATSPSPGAVRPQVPDSSGKTAVVPSSGIVSPQPAPAIKKDAALNTKMAKTTPKKKKSPPLVCEANPGTMEGISGRSEYLLTGDVKCDYGNLHFETSRAIWNRNENEVVCEGGVKVTLNGLILTADRGGYRQKHSELWARNNVKTVDSAGIYEFTGHNLLYNMEDRWLTLTSRPMLKKFFKKGKTTDTLSFTAKRILYNDSLRIAKAERDVQIIRGNLVIDCKRGTYWEKEQLLDLEENPVAHLNKNELKGDRMRITLEGEEVTGLGLKDNSSGVYYEGDSGGIPENTYILQGDSLFMKIKDEVMEFVEIFKNGTVTHKQKQDTAKINSLAGEFLKLDFIKEKIHAAVVKGDARSTFYIYEDERYQGRSLADGDSIGFAFEEGKVVDVHIRGNAKGIYMGEPEMEKPIAKEEDSVN